MKSSAPLAIDALKQTPHGLEMRSRIIRPAVMSPGSWVFTRRSRTSKAVAFVIAGVPRYVAFTRNADPTRSMDHAPVARALRLETGVGAGSTERCARLRSG